MSLTADQKAKIKKILLSYQRDVRTIVKKHKMAVGAAVTEMDKKKTEEIHRLIQSRT